MAALLDSTNFASPLAYQASQTALLLLDFQNFCVDRCRQEGLSALARATAMRDWAVVHRVMILHSVVDVNATPPITCKGYERTTRLLEEVALTKGAAHEATEIACGSIPGECLVFKHPGVVSGLKSAGMMELLQDHGIKSLILCGISTSGAVLRTAVPATDDGFVVTVIRDACTDPVEGLHEVLIGQVLPSRAHVLTADEFMAAWES